MGRRLLIKNMKLNPIGPNQNEVAVNGKLILFSYQTPVAALVDGVLYRTDCRWSKTTSNHINKWLGTQHAEEKPQAFFDSLV